MIFLFVVLLVFAPVYADSADLPAGDLSVEKANELIKNNKPEDALKLLSAFRPSTEDIHSYYYAYSKAFELKKMQAEAVENLRLAYIYSPAGETRERLLLERAEIYKRMQYYSEAAVSYRVFLRTFPGSDLKEKAHMGLADMLYRLGLFNEAVINYEKSGSSSNAVYGKANALQSGGRTKEAHDVFMDMITKDRGYLSSSPEAAYNIGENFRLMGQYPEAKSYFNLIKDPLLKHKADLSQGLIAIEEARPDSALKHFNSAMNSPDWRLRRFALLQLAGMYVKSGKLEEAKSRLLEIRNEYPYGKEYDDALLMLSQIYKKEGKHEESVFLLKELVLRRSPDSKALNEFEVMILDAEEKNHGLFLKLWKSVGYWLMEPSRSQSLMKIAKGLRSEGKTFIELCSWLSKHGSGDEKTWGRIEMADFYADLGDTEAAMKYVKQVDAKEYKNDLHRIKARIYSRNSEYQKALDEITSIKELKTEDTAIVSDIIKSSGNTKKTVDFFEKALNKTGGSAKAYLKLADICYEQGRRTDAVKYYKTAVSIKADEKSDYNLTADDLKWAHLRIVRLSDDRESADVLKKTSKAGSTLDRFAEAGIKESVISERLDKVN
jgi:tetratricopeptide (TPR) repeat protein